MRASLFAFGAVKCEAIRNPFFHASYLQVIAYFHDPGTIIFRCALFQLDVSVESGEQASFGGRRDGGHIRPPPSGLGCTSSLQN